MNKRRVFVGRGSHLQAFSRWLDLAVDGQPQVVLLAGPAGIGKSALTERVRAEAGLRGLLVASAAAHEDLSIPYLPIAGLLRPLLHDADLTADLTHDELETLRAFLVPTAELPATDLDAEAQDRRRLGLFLATSRLVVRAALARPTLLVVEDLQWADTSSLDLLTHLVASVSHEAARHEVPLLLVVTHRPARPEAHAARAVDRLAREPIAHTVTLDGLDTAEVNQLVIALQGQRPSRAQLVDLIEASAGNPLLVTRLSARLARGEEVGGRMAEIDAELRDQLGGLPEIQLDVLTTAAVLGDGSGLAELAAVSSQTSADVDDALEELDAEGLLREDGATYHFAHPGLQPVVLDRLGSREQRARHAEAADRLEQFYGDDRYAHALELLHHLRRAGSRDHERLLALGRAAGSRASAGAAWAEAAEAYATALAAAARVELPERERLALYQQAAWAHFQDHQNDVCIPMFEQAIELARAQGAHERWGQLVLGLLRVRLTTGRYSLGRLIDLAPAREFLDAVAGDEDLAHLRGRVMALVAECQFSAFDFEAGLASCDQARKLAASTGDEDAAAAIDFAEGLQHLGRLDLARARRSFADAAGRASHTGQPRHQVWALGRDALARAIAGDLRGADEQARDVTHLAAPAYLWAELSLLNAVRTGIAVLQGRFADAEARGVDAVLTYHRSESPFSPGIFFPQIAAARALRGDSTGAEEALDDWSATGGRGVHRVRLLVAALAGDHDEVRREVAQGAWRPVGDRPPSLVTVTALAAQVEIAAVTNRADLAADALPGLAALHGNGVVFTPEAPLLLARLLGVASSLTGDHVAVAEWFETAEREARAAGARVEAARLLLDRARTGLAADAEPDALRVLLDHAGVALDRLGLLPFTRQVRELQAQLTDAVGLAGAAADRAALQTRVLLTTDLVQSTELNVRVGDQRYLELLREHNRIVRRRLREFDGVEFKHTGDGICSWFASASNALRAALRVQEDLERVNLEHPDMPLSVRCGLAAGEPMVEGDDLFGVAVSRAARVCAEADGGQVLLSSEVADPGTADGVVVEALRVVALKGLPDPVSLYIARPADPRT